jgi:hypothetical protein
MNRQFIVKSGSRRSHPLAKRDLYALNASDRLKIRIMTSHIAGLCKILVILPHTHRHLRIPIIKSITDAYCKLLQIVVVEVPKVELSLKHDPMTFTSMEQKLRSLEITCSERFRFQSFDHLRELVQHFRIPAIINAKGYRVCADECIMIVLTRLHYPCRWSDMYIWFPGRKRWFLQAVFYWSLDFFIFNWGYLLLNNLP